MLPVWIVYASNFDLNIPECHITDSSLSLYIFDSLGAQYHDMKLSLYHCINILIYITDPYSCVCHLCAFVHMCACACVCACARVCVHLSVYTYVHVSSSTLKSMSRYTAVVVHLIHIQVWQF